MPELGQRRAAGAAEPALYDRTVAGQRALLEAMPFAISVVSEEDQQVLYANQRWAAAFRPAEARDGTPRDLLELLDPQDRAAVLAEHRRRGQVDGFEARWRTADDEPFWVVVATRSLVYEGAPARLTVCTSLNERKRAEAALERRTDMLHAIGYAATRIIGAADWRPAMRELLERLGTAADVSRVFLFEIHPAPDGRGRVQSVRFDWAAPGLEPLTGDPLYTSSPVEDDDSMFADWFRRRERGEVVQVRLSETEGSARAFFEETGCFAMLSVPIFADGAFWGSLGFDDCVRERLWEEADVDVLRIATALIAGAIERARADEKLRERERQLVEAQRIAHVGSWELDFATKRVTWSLEGWRIFGLEADQTAWSHEENLRRIHPEDRERVALADKLAEEEGVAFDIEYRILRPDGEERTLRERADRICDAGGRPLRLIGTVHDITEIKRADEALVRQREALHQSEKLAMFGSLLAGVAHELNNPLSIVIGQAALLEERASDPAVVQRAERIRRATDRCARIVRTFLAMARQRRAEPRLVSLNAVVEMAVDLLGPQLRSGDVRVELALSDDLPPVLIDADQIHQVVTNLVLNACHALADHAPPRLLRIATAHDAAAQLARLTVADNGPGVAEELRTRIFDPFFTTKPAGEGTGIGLSLCSSIVRAHEGDIAVSRTPGGGATFTVTLPLRAAAEPAAADPIDSAPSARRRILIIEDEPGIAETLAEILQRQGHDTEIASDGQQALERVSGSRYDLILSDLRMPVIDGPGFYGALCERWPEMAGRIAFITGDALSTDTHAFLARVGAPCLEKPFSPQDLTRLVARSLERAR
jgi:PAS domain S-box-containing protein